MGIFSKFKNKKAKPSGIIGNLGLSDFYATLTESEKEDIRDSLAHPYQLTTGTPYTREDLDTGNRNYGGGNPVNFLYEMATSVSTPLTIKLCKEALRLATNEFDKHFPRQILGESLYKLGRYEECEYYCLEDIQNIDAFLSKPGFERANVQTFKRLAIMYEKQNRISEAIAISEQALKYKQHDYTKNGYEGRIIKLQKKLKA